MRSIKVISALVATALVLVACAEVAPPSTGLIGDLTMVPEGEPPPVDPELVAQGLDLYRANCASCHQNDLSGAPDWKIPLADGSYAPPPMDNSGHTWHHPDQQLVAIIRGDRGYDSNMPEFRELSDEQILSILEYFRSEWGDEERLFQWQNTVRKQG